MSNPKFFANGGALRRWLEKHAAEADELVVGFYKIDSGRPSISWSESVDEALCFGWIDSVRKRIDEHRYQIRFTPRKVGSIWSAINIAKIEKLRAEGRMTATGEAAFAHRREARSIIYSYEQSEIAELPPEQLREFKRQKQAWQFFQAAPPGYRKLMLHWVTRARKPETRTSRFAALLQACLAGKRLR